MVLQIIEAGDFRLITADFHPLFTYRCDMLSGSMAKVYVSAYFMHEYEEEAAKKLMPGAVATEGFLMGEVEESDIPKLTAAGLMVQQSPASTASEATREIGVGAVADFYRVRLKGPVVEPWRLRLLEAGCALIEADETGAYTAKLDGGQINAVSALPFVESVTWIVPKESVSRAMTDTGAAVRDIEGAVIGTYDVRLHLPEDLGSVVAWLQARNIKIEGSAGRKIRIIISNASPELDALGQLTEVDKVDPYIPPELYNDIARMILGIDAPAGQTPASFIKQDGTGQIVAVADTGIDDQHPDFQGRIFGKLGLGRPGITTDPQGHGTHVSGSILGDGTASNGQIRGMAPKANLYFQSLLDANGKLTGLPLDLNDLFRNAYDADPRIRIHSNSWGSATPSTYTFNSEEVDQFIWDHRDMLIVIAAGNAGRAAQALRADKGFVDWLSIGSPASCKNALTVGASRSSRTDGPLSNSTYGAIWPSLFPDPPIASEKVSGDPDSLAAFSSRGPCDDFRVKPDVVAPGTDIASTKSSQALISNFAGPYPNSAAPNVNYAFDQGTSMATPLVSGCAALVRQYYTELPHEPSAALLKSTIINSTQWLGGTDANAAVAGVPNYHQGFGRVAVHRAIPNESDPDLALQFIDNWKDPASAFTRTGQRRKFQFTLPNDVPELRFCMAYTDSPGRAIQNNLNLLVQHMESNKKWPGNPDRPDRLTVLDTTNNVEVVRVPNALKGTYVLVVIASNLLKTPQDYALVVTARGLPPLTPA